MRLLVPYIGEVSRIDRRMILLAEFLGITCETFSLEKELAGSFEEAVPKERCLLVNPQVIKEWVGGQGIPEHWATSLLERFHCLLVHGLCPDAFDISTVVALSRGRIRSIEPIDGNPTGYEVGKHSNDVCGIFEGLSFGPANPKNDHVFSLSTSDQDMRELISINGRPFMMLLKESKGEIIFVGSKDVADLSAETDDRSVFGYFSRFVPQAMALRYVFAEQSWRPCQHHASVIIDDLLLRKNYGFINFESLHRLADEYNFHVAVGFIPHNFRRNASVTTRLVRENPARLSICFHGNDHTGSEFASTEETLLNTMLDLAKDRMKVHQETTEVPCDKVMVFPQGRFSVEAMNALKSHNFLAAVNTVPRPVECPRPLTIGDLSRPAVLRYGDFALFLRNRIEDLHRHDIAFRLFFGRPVLLCAHHDIGQRLDSLAEFALQVNSMAPGIHWANLATVVSNSLLKRRAPNRTYHIQAYSGCVRVVNDSDSSESYRIEWPRLGDRSSVVQVLSDTIPCDNFQVDALGIRLSVELDTGSSKSFSVVYGNESKSYRALGFRRNAKAFIRRRLSEFRDDYVATNPRLLSTVTNLRRVVSSVMK